MDGTGLTAWKMKPMRAYVPKGSNHPATAHGPVRSQHFRQVLNAEARFRKNPHVAEKHHIHAIFGDPWKAGLLMRSIRISGT
jgi:hypothetical protein